MKCEEIKNFIIAYIDGEISEALGNDIAKHLKVCSSCREKEQSLRCTVIEPLNKAEKVEAPERIWYQVRNTIINKKEKRLLARTAMEWLGYLRIRKPGLVPLAVTIILFITVFLFRNTIITQKALESYIEEQTQFLSQLAENGEESYLGIEDINLGTSIEKYFL